MRTLVAITQVSLDGVMQAPGGPEEDPSHGFAHGGWAMPLIDDAGMEAVHETVGGEFDLLLGRRTYDNWIGYWPRHEDDPIGAAFAKATKYVVTHRPDGLAWPTSKRIGGDVVAEVRRLKTSKGPPLHLWGSSEVLHRLAAADLVDEFRVWVFPVLLGAGKRLFGPDMPPRRLTLVDTRRTPSGIVLNTYRPAGPLATA
jgi:dihydrofolate reductase